MLIHMMNMGYVCSKLCIIWSKIITLQQYLVHSFGVTFSASDQKPILHKTTEELEKCQNRIMYLDAARKYLEVSMLELCVAWV